MRVAILWWMGVLGAQALELRLPTENTALLSGDGRGFYQFVDRTFEGQVSSPWEGGRFGFTRTPKRVGGQLVYERFHEGLDIKPVRRDAGEEPLDEVMAMSEGRVVHVSKVSSHSNYGRYVVVEHDWGDGPFYSLYAHLMTTAVESGQAVAAGAVLGRMGYTGAGIDRRRAHVHVEMAMLWSSEFEGWHGRLFRDPNHHGVYNGMNLIGMDLEALLLTHREEPGMSVAEFVQRTPVYFEVAVPGSATLEIVERYPWLLASSGVQGQPGSWRLRCSAWGLPIAVVADERPVSEAEVVGVVESALPHSYATRGLLHGSGRQATLSTNGQNLIRLVCGE